MANILIITICTTRRKEKQQITHNLLLIFRHRANKKNTITHSIYYKRKTGTMIGATREDAVSGRGRVLAISKIGITAKLWV